MRVLIPANINPRTKKRGVTPRGISRRQRAWVKVLLSVEEQARLFELAEPAQPRARLDAEVRVLVVGQQATRVGRQAELTMMQDGEDAAHTLQRQDCF